MGILATGAGTFKGTLKQARELAAKQNKDVVLKFYADWCSSCQKLDREVLTKEMVSRLSRNAVMTYMNVDRPAARALAEKFNVKGIPTTIVLDNTGREIDRIVGYSNRSKWTKTLLGYMYGIDTLQDNLEKAAKNDSPKLGEEIAGKYLERGNAKQALEWVGRAKKLLTGKDPKLADRLSLIRGEALLETDPPTGEKLLRRLAVKGSQDQADGAFDTLSRYYRLKARESKNPEEKKSFLDKMTALYDAALPKHENDSGFLNNYAWHFAEEGINLDKALEAAQKAVKLSNNDPGILDTLAETYYKKGMKTKALEAIGKALQKDPDDSHFRKQKEKFLKMPGKTGNG